MASVTMPVKLLVNEHFVEAPTLNLWPAKVRLPEVIEVRDKEVNTGLTSWLTNVK
jgi:hypothetical protein